VPEQAGSLPTGIFLFAQNNNSLQIYSDSEDALVASLIGAGESVVPGEAVLVEDDPKEAEGERADGDQDGKDATAQGAACGVLVVEGA
jgi:hypothetical protein